VSVKTVWNDRRFLFARSGVNPRSPFSIRSCPACWHSTALTARGMAAPSPTGPLACRYRKRSVFPAVVLRSERQ